MLIEEYPVAPPCSSPALSGRPGKHIPALDGVRGVAILAVLLFHGFLSLHWQVPGNAWVPKCFTFGWVGVDIFFVLSGFLITGILLDTRQTPNRFRNFYVRRFLRIIPVYYLLLTIIFVILPFFVSFNTPGLQKIQQNQGWMWTHLTNLGFVWHRKVWATADWLALDHCWSLAIEEQFYMVWPLLVYFFDRKNVKRLCIACIVFSPALRALLWMLHMRNGALYFPTPCRLDGLAMGALVAVLVREGIAPATLRTTFRKLVVAACLLLGALVIWRGGFVFTDSAAVVFGPCLINVIAASVIVFTVLPEPQRLLIGLLSIPALRVAGKYSYGLYLFHVPLLAPLQYLVPASLLVGMMHSELAGNLMFVGLFMAVSFGVAFLSWHAFEKHFLKLKCKFEAR